MIRAENQCEGKVKYDTSEQAHAATRHMNQRGKVKVSAYKCPDCGKRHFGHAGKGKKMRPNNVRVKIRYEY